MSYIRDFTVCIPYMVPMLLYQAITCPYSECYLMEMSLAYQSIPKQIEFLLYGQLYKCLVYPIIYVHDLSMCNHITTQQSSNCMHNYVDEL